ncbi:SDR family NAD(P)-dependent oxidoreductase [Streptomyces fractus]|uniref:SDR family NAD(P)-dependent oxidoreductase n=1 Tax=Streptomyces fractus TaxID=641806 RepID=UPI003CE81E2F
MSLDSATPVIAVVLAGGVGSRTGLGFPKQLAKVAGKTLLEHTVSAFDQSEDIDEVYVLMEPTHLDAVKALMEGAGFRKVSQVMAGGTSRKATTQVAIAALTERFGDDCPVRVLFHDAVRPFVSQRVIRECVQALEQYEAVDVAIPSSDTIVMTETNTAGDAVLSAVPDRSMLRRGQTPQCFRLPTIRRAYELARAEPKFTATDDCSVVLRELPEVEVCVVEGDESNMKVTQPLDLHIADKIFQLASGCVRDLVDEDAEQQDLSGRTLVVFGGSYGIGRNVAEQAARRGATVFSHSRSTTNVHVENPADVERALRQAFEATGRVDYVVNTAGILRVGELGDSDRSAIDEVLQVNLAAPIHIARSSRPYLERTGGQLLLYTSSSYTRGRAGYGLYSATKAAVVNLTQALSDEWAAAGVRINCINPERTATPMRTAAFGREPEGSLLRSEHVAATSLDVLTADITGQIVDVRRTPTPSSIVPHQTRIAEAA